MAEVPAGELAESCVRQLEDELAMLKSDSKSDTTTHEKERSSLKKSCEELTHENSSLKSKVDNQLAMKLPSKRKSDEEKNQAKLEDDKWKAEQKALAFEQCRILNKESIKKNEKMQVLWDNSKAVEHQCKEDEWNAKLKKTQNRLGSSLQALGTQNPPTT